MEDRTIIILRAKKCLSCEPGGVCWTGGWSNLCLRCIRGANGQGWRIWNPGLFGASALEIELSTWNSAPSSVTQFCCPDFSCERSPKQTVQPVSWSWFFSTGNWGLFCEGNWRLLLQCYGIPCTQVHYHVIYNLVENHSMLCSHSDLTEGSSWVELSREA
jgi:hypothetical protein